MDPDEATRRRIYWAQRQATIRAAVDAHLRRLHAQGIDLVCPICRTRQWQLHGTVVPTPFDEGVNTSDPFDPAVDAMLDTPVVPKVVLVCMTCAYTAEFAWLQIKNPTTTQR